MDVDQEISELTSSLESWYMDDGVNCDIKPLIEMLEWKPSDFLPGLYVDKPLPQGAQLFDLSIDFLTEGQMSIMAMRMDEKEYLPVCDKATHADVRGRASKRPGHLGTLCEALLAQAENQAKTKQWWHTIITHHQRLRHVWAQGRHVLYALARPLGLDPAVSSRHIVRDDTHNLLRKGLNDIRLLTIQAQFLVLQMYGLAQLRDQWAKRLGLSDGSNVLSMSAHQLLEAADTLLDWRSATVLFFTKSRRDWAAMCRRQQVSVEDDEFPKLQFTLGNPVNMRLPSGFEGAIAAVRKEINLSKLANATAQSAGDV